MAENRDYPASFFFVKIFRIESRTNQTSNSLGPETSSQQAGQMNTHDHKRRSYFFRKERLISMLLLYDKIVNVSEHAFFSMSVLQYATTQESIP
jgi:hypothetical protein